MIALWLIVHERTASAKGRAAAGRFKLMEGGAFGAGDNLKSIDVRIWHRQEVQFGQPERLQRMPKTKLST